VWIPRELRISEDSSHRYISGLRSTLAEIN
jgi:hypothetical protein